MKKLALLLALVLLMTCASGALAEVDLSEVHENPNIFTLDVLDSGVAVVETTMSVQLRSFTHKYESDAYYSSTQFDFAVVNYGQSTAYVVQRLWISFATNDDFMDIDSVTFHVGGQDFTFTDITDPEWYTRTEKGCMQRVMIKFGRSNLAFLAALEKCVPDDPMQLSETDGLITMTLHGLEDVEVSLTSGFLTDFAVIKEAFLEANGGDYLDKASATPMTIE